MSKSTKKPASDRSLLLMKIQELKNELRDSENRVANERKGRSEDVAAAYANGIEWAARTLEIAADREEQDAREAGLKADVPTELHMFRKASTFRIAAYRVRGQIPSRANTCEAPAPERVKGEVGAALANAVKTLASIGKEVSR